MSLYNSVCTVSLLSIISNIVNFATVFYISNVAVKLFMFSNSYTHPPKTPASVPASFRRYQAEGQRSPGFAHTRQSEHPVQRQNRQSGNLSASYSVHCPVDVHSSAKCPAFAERTWKPRQHQSSCYTLH